MIGAGGKRNRFRSLQVRAARDAQTPDRCKLRRNDREQATSALSIACASPSDLFDFDAPEAIGELAQILSSGNPCFLCATLSKQRQQLKISHILSHVVSVRRPGCLKRARLLYTGDR